MTDGQTTCHFAPYIWVQVRKSDIYFPLHMGIKLRQTNKPHSIPQIGIHVRLTDKLCFILRLTLTFRQTDGQTTFNFTPHIGIHVWQTEKLRDISSLILESTYDRTDNISFHHSCLDQRQTDGQTTLHFILNFRLRLFYPHVVVFDRQTDKLRFISLMLSSK